MNMLISPRRRTRSTKRPLSTKRALPTTLALAASALLAAAPLAGAQSTTEADGTIAVSSLGSTTDTPGSLSGSLGSVASSEYADYVALGDSYAALGDNRESAGGPASCSRSLANYPNALDDLDARVRDLTDVTCGGAIMPDLAGEDSDGVAPQFDALSTDTDLITLSIGGNDVGFAAIVGCITRQGPFAELPAAATCESQIGAMVSADIASAYAEDGPIDDVYADIEELSPSATVVATQYMPLMPAEGVSCDFTDSLNPADVAWARGITEDINVAVDSAATRNGHVSVMPTDDVDRSACADADQRWTSFAGVPDHTAPMHPTALGQAAMAEAISAAL